MINGFPIVFLLFGTVLCVGDDVAKLRFYQSSLDDYVELPINEAQQILSTSWYDPEKTTVIFTHGFSGFPNGPAVTVVITTYLGVGHNVALLNWQEQAAPVMPSMFNSYLNWAYPNSKKLGVEFAETLWNLSVAGLDLNKTHLVGHSLGAHIFGIAGNKLQDRGILLPWITGLDPATVGFENKPPAVRLNPDSAGFVAVIHSDPSKYGFKRSLGTVDFWPNYSPGTVTQPGCDRKNHPTFTPEGRKWNETRVCLTSSRSTPMLVIGIGSPGGVSCSCRETLCPVTLRGLAGDAEKCFDDSRGYLCNHNRCWELLLDAVVHPGTILGSHAPNYRKWRKYSDEEKQAHVLELGVYEEKALPGNYFFTTNAISPYGQGVDGL